MAKHGLQLLSWKGRDMKHRILGLANTYATLILLVIFVGVFSALRPATFATWSNVSSLISSGSVITCLALAALIPLIIGEFDLSFGYTVGVVGVMGARIGAEDVTPWLVIASMLGAGALIGLVNGLLTVSLNISSFISTLGIGILLSGFTTALSNGQVLVKGIPSPVTWLGQHQLLSITMSAWGLLLIAFLLYYFLQHTPRGRYLFAIGGAIRVARLAGINTNGYRIFAFVLSGLLAGLAGVIALGQNGAAVPTYGPELLLPAYAAVFLGVTSFRPGRYNVAGTVVAILVLSVGVSGIQLLGAPLWSEPVFHGCVLLIAVLIAKTEARRVAVGA
jgi:ribose transport system permease protein